MSNMGAMFLQPGNHMLGYGPCARTSGAFCKVGSRMCGFFRKDSRTGAVSQHEIAECKDMASMRGKLAG